MPSSIFLWYISTLDNSGRLYVVGDTGLIVIFLKEWRRGRPSELTRANNT